MRIDAYNQIAQVYKTTSAAKLQKTENARHGRDEVQISSFGRDYLVDTADFAKKLLEKYNTSLM